jgi:hypothetical protein
MLIERRRFLLPPHHLLAARARLVLETPLVASRLRLAHQVLTFTIAQASHGIMALIATVSRSARAGSAAWFITAGAITKIGWQWVAA